MDEAKFVQLLEKNNQKLMSQFRGEMSEVVEANNVEIRQVVEANNVGIRQILEENNVQLRAEMSEVVLDALQQVVMPVLNQILEHLAEHDENVESADHRMGQYDHRLDQHDRRLIALEKPAVV